MYYVFVLSRAVVSRPEYIQQAGVLPARGLPKRKKRRGSEKEQPKQSRPSQKRIQNLCRLVLGTLVKKERRAGSMKS